MSAPAFTPTEWEILKHRLDVPDAIADTLTDDARFPEYSWGEIRERAESIAEHPNEIELDQLSALGLAILQDCCDGSTFFADIDDAIERGEVSRGWATARYRAAVSLGIKLSTVVTAN